MKALNLRVLTHVPTRELHQSYNAVLHEEFVSASQALDDVLTAFAKLEEVRDAVSKLQQSHESSSGGHSSNTLMAAADGTIKMHQQLERQVKKLAGGIGVDKKRKRKEEENYRVAKKTERSDAGVDLDLEETKRDAPKSKREERNGPCAATPEVAATSSYQSSSSSETEGTGDGDDEEANDDYGGALPTEGKLNEPPTGVMSDSEPANDAEKSDTDDYAATQTLKKSATCMKVIVEEVNKLKLMNQWFIMPELLAALKESVEEDADGMQQSDVAWSIEVLIGWGTHHKTYQARYADLYREYTAAVELYAERLPSSEHKSKLLKLKETLSSTIEAFDGHALDFRKVAKRRAAIQEAKRKEAFSRIGGPDTVPPEKRISQLLHLLVAFKMQTAEDADSSVGDRMVRVTVKLSLWFNGDPVQSRVLRMIFSAFRDFSGRIPAESTRNRVTGLVDNMLEDISDPSHGTHDRLSKFRSCATQILAEAQQYEGKAILTSEARSLIKAVESLVKVTAAGWNPRKDPTVCQCVKVLKNICVQSQNYDGQPRNIPLSKVWKADFGRWKVEELPELDR